MEKTFNCQDLDGIKSEIKAACTLERFVQIAARHYPEPPVKIGDGYRFPEDCRDRNPAMTITLKNGEPVWYDHRRNEGGDVIRFVQLFQFGGYKETYLKAVNWLAEEIGVSMPEPQKEPPKPTPEPKKEEQSVSSQPQTKSKDEEMQAQKEALIQFVALYGGMLRDGLHTPMFKSWCKLRGFNPDLVAGLPSIGFVTQYTVFDVAGFKFKALYPNTCIWWNIEEGTLKAIQFSKDTGKRNPRGCRQLGSCWWKPKVESSDEIWVTEGETSAIALIQMGKPARPCKPEYLGSIIDEVHGETPKRLYLAYDNDPQGKLYTKKALEIFPDAIDISGMFPEGGDSNDFLIQFGVGQFEAALKEKEALVSKAKQAKTEESEPFREACNAIKPFLHPVIDKKTGEASMSFDVKDIEPLVVWLKTRGVYEEQFCYDNGWRTPEGNPLTNASLTRELIALQKYGGFPAMGISGGSMMKRAAELAVTWKKRDALRETIENLPKWDGVNRIDKFWSTYCGASDTPLNTAISRYMWTAIIGRALASEKPCKADMCIILKGSQGLGKSTLTKALSLNYDWHKEINSNSDEDEITRSLRATQIIELAEMGSLGKKALATLKRVLTMDKLSCRKKGNDEFWKFNMRAFFIATNDSTDGILTDPNGQRRWLPVYVKGVKALPRGGDIQMVLDTDGVERDKLQLYAEALELFKKNGVMWYGISCTDQKELCKQEIETSENAQAIYDYMLNRDVKEITLRDAIVDCLFGGDTDRALNACTSKRFQAELSNDLKAMGFTKTSKRGYAGNTKYWSHPDFEKNTLTPKQAIEEARAVEDGILRNAYLKRHPDRAKRVEALICELKGLDPENPFNDDYEPIPVMVDTPLEELLKC